MTIDWKTVEQYFTVALFVFNFTQFLILAIFQREEIITQKAQQTSRLLIEMKIIEINIKNINPSPGVFRLFSADWNNLLNTILMGEPNTCMINVRNPKVIKVHKRVIFTVIALIPLHKAKARTPQPATNTSHVLSNAIRFW